MFAGGGASAAGSACAVQPTSTNSAAVPRLETSVEGRSGSCRAFRGLVSFVVQLELHHDRHSQTGLIFAEVGSPQASVRGCGRTAGRPRGTEVGAYRVEGIAGVWSPSDPGRTPVVASIELGRSVVAARRRDPTAPGVIRLLGRPIPEFPKET